MIDSTTINFALSKIDSVIKKALPHIQEGGEAFVSFYVLRYGLVETLPWVVGALLFFVVFIVGGNRTKWKIEDVEKNPVGLIWMLPGLVWVSLFIPAFIGIMDCILAINHPVIFTIMNMAGK